jgi:hypothetical protein
MNDSPKLERAWSVRFSIRRLLLAIAFFALILGLMTRYSQRLWILRPGIGVTCYWWAATIAWASGASGIVLLVRRCDWFRICKATASVLAGMMFGLMVGSFFTADPPLYNPWLSAYPGGIVGWFVGCIIFEDGQPLPPAR